MSRSHKEPAFSFGQQTAPKASPSQNVATLTTVFQHGAAGLPALLLQQFGPRIFHFAGRHPRLAKFTSGTAVFAIVAVAAAKYTADTLKFVRYPHSYLFMTPDRC